MGLTFVFHWQWIEFMFGSKNGTKYISLASMAPSELWQQN